MELQTLYHKGKSGAIYQWRTWTEGADVLSEHGQVGGQMQIARYTAEAKNVGRANETTPEQQAELEAYSEWQHKQDIKYKLDVASVHDVIVDVMKAPTEKWAVTGKKYATYPADVQLKYDGCRCLAYWKDGRIVLQSRGRKEWNLPHIVAQLEKCLPGDAMFDGEIYFHGVKLQVIQSWISKQRPESKKLMYLVYDIPMADGIDGKISEDRMKDLDRLVPGGPHEPAVDTPNIMKAITLEVTDEDGVLAFQTVAIEKGYEGAMYRNRKGTYQAGVRSKYLLKVKTFEDKEFKVIGFTDGIGRNVELVTWICALDVNAPIIGCVSNSYQPNSEEGVFKCDPLGTLNDRADWFANGNQYMGQMLKVKFAGLTNLGIPKIAKGVAFRLAEDTDTEGAF